MTGRTFGVRRPNALDRLRLLKALGPKLSENMPYVGMATLAYAVTNVDGIPIPQPVNEAQLEAVIARLGDDGLQAVATLFDRWESEQGNGSVGGNQPSTPI